ncbi:hypothetical protein LCGC14_0459290 [marine sediment metagenome]|uniref:Nudix hydrolase domain-containing protein n=1 Tax=marine sediment metagenome TaxID=412755 RepID=A0A0F9SFK3_9ZZZZ
MKVIYTTERLPNSITRSIMLCGPTPRTKEVLSWRPEALKMLELLGYEGTVFVPELRPASVRRENPENPYVATGCYAGCYDWDKQVKWEYDAIEMSDCVLFWVPREIKTMPAFTTNDEWGYLKGSGKVVFGAPDGAPKTRYQKHFAELFCVPKANTLAETVKNAMDKVSKGATRKGGECNVPLMVWNTPSFQSWYGAHKEVGNYLGDAKLLWSFRVGPRRDFVFAYTLWVDIWIEAERRFKRNEFVFSRTDISVVVLYRKAEKFEDTEIVLVKEFRSPVRNKECFVYENPGGSSFKAGQDPIQVASDEVFEETGLRLLTGRFAYYAPRQVAATLSTHVAHLYAAELTKEEMMQAKEAAETRKMYGNIGDSEQTYLHVATVKDLMGSELPVDWSMFGMIMRAIV